MTDENNLMSQEPEEVVSWYIPKEQGEEVVHCYVQPRPLPEKACGEDAQVAVAEPQKKKGWVIFLILVAILVTVIGITTILVHLFSGKNNETHDDGSAGSIVDIIGDEDCWIPACGTNPDVRMELSAPPEESLTASEIYGKVLPSTVTVLSSANGGKTVMGTGIILTSDGYFVTNAHIITGCKSCMIVLYDGSTYDAELVGYDVSQDIAVLKAMHAADLIPADFCDSDYTAVGDRVYAIGNPLSLRLRATFTEGMISGISREVEVDGKIMTMLQTDAAVNNGNSGGPLLNDRGQVVGIVTMKMSNQNTTAGATVEGLGFALPTANVAYVVNDLLFSGAYSGVPTFGFVISTEPTADGESRVVVQSVEEGSPAQASGIQPGDILLAADGHTLRDNWELLDYRRTLHVGDTVDLTVLRNGVEIHCRVTLTGTK